MSDKGCKHEPNICDHCIAMTNQTSDPDWCPLCEIDRLKARIEELEYQLWLVDDLGFYSKPDVPPPANPQSPREGERHVLMGVEYIFLNGEWRRYVEPPDFK